MRIHWNRVLYVALMLVILTVGFFIVRNSYGVKNSEKIVKEMGPVNAMEVVKPNIRTIISQPSSPFLLKGHPENKLFAVILVTSMAEDFVQRQFIRQTWYKWAEKLDIRVFFMMGDNKPLKQVLNNEQVQYNDLIIDDYREGYYKLSGKVLRMLKWYNATYSAENSPLFFVKTDQDVFVNIEKLVTALKDATYYKTVISGKFPAYNLSSPDTYYVGGGRFTNGKVDDNKFSKWYIDISTRVRYHWPITTYPTYANGQLYVFSGNVVRTIYDASLDVPVFPFEDVYLLGMVANQRVGLHISNLGEMWREGNTFLYFFWSRGKVKEMMSIHPVDGENMIKICKMVDACSRVISSDNKK